jgi:hypothetical protein
MKMIQDGIEYRFDPKVYCLYCAFNPKDKEKYCKVGSDQCIRMDGAWVKVEKTQEVKE